MSDIILDLYHETKKGDANRVKKLVKKAINQGITPVEVLEKGLRPSMEEVGQKFEKLEIFLPSMMKAADAMKVGVEILQPYLGSDDGDVQKGLILLGTVEGDVHEIGKNIVKIMLEANGFEVKDLRYDVDSIGLKIQSGSPFEITGCTQHIYNLRLAAKQVGRPGVFLVAVGTAEHDSG